MTPKEMRDRLSKIPGTAKIPRNTSMIDGEFITAIINNLVVLLREIDTLDSENRLLKSENTYMQDAFRRLANFDGTEAPVLFAQNVLDDLEVLRHGRK